MAKILSGKIVSARVKDELKKEVEELSQRGKQTGLAVVLVGDDSASVSYTHLTLPTKRIV